MEQGSHICEEEAALSLSEIQHGSEPDSQQLRLLGHVAPCNGRERLQSVPHCDSCLLLHGVRVMQQQCQDSPKQDCPVTFQKFLQDSCLQMQAVIECRRTCLTRG